MKDAAAKRDGQQASESVYDRDYYAWVQEQVKALRERRPEALDWENLREEVEDLGRHERRELRSHLKLILVHLLKWEFQSRKRSRSWRSTIVEQRRQASSLIRENSSLRRQLGELLAEAYRLATPAAAAEMGLDILEWERGALPSQCPWSVEQVLDEDFLPAMLRTGSRSRSSG